MTKPVTSHDVARLAGVSQPTVSRALRNLPGTSPQTRQRVLDAAEALAYVPNASGRTLSTSKTRRIAIVAEELTNPFYPALVEPIRRRLADLDYRTVLVTDRGEDSVSAESLSDGSYDGIALCTVSRRSRLPRDLTERGVPHVLVNRTLDHPDSSSCTFDNRAGSSSLALLLCDLGHVEIAAIQGPTEFSTSHDRADGLRAALRSRGRHLRRDRVRRVPYSYDTGLDAAQSLLELVRRPTAILCANDVLAIGAMAAARRAGLTVPTDLTIVGFDDIPTASWDLIDLTTVRCDLDAMAAEAVALLAEAIDGQNLRHVEIPVDLVRRSTHAQVPDPASRPAR